MSTKDPKKVIRKERTTSKKVAAKAKAEAIVNPEVSDGTVEVGPAVKSPKIMLGLPWYKYTHPIVSFFIMALIKLHKDNLLLVPKFGDAMIYHARNKLAERFLATDYDYLMMIDDDMIVPVGVPELFRGLCGLPDDYPWQTCSQSVINRLVGHGVDVVGATYYGRHKDGPLMSHAGMTNQGVQRVTKEGTQTALAKTEWVGTGCILIHRSVFEKIRAHYGDSLVLTPEMGSYGYFMPDNQGGEDQAFGRRANAAGCNVYVDPGLHCLHLGFSAWGSHNV